MAVSYIFSDSCHVAASLLLAWTSLLYLVILHGLVSGPSTTLIAVCHPKEMIQNSLVIGLHFLVTKRFLSKTPHSGYFITNTDLLREESHAIEGNMINLNSSLTLLIHPFNKHLLCTSYSVSHLVRYLRHRGEQDRHGLFPRDLRAQCGRPMTSTQATGQTPIWKCWEEKDDNEMFQPLILHSSHSIKSNSHTTME